MLSAMVGTMISAVAGTAGEAAQVTVFDLIFSTTFLFTVIRVTTPILFAALGGCITARTGVPNIALEGMMLCAALAGVLTSGGMYILTKNEWIATPVGVLAGVIVGVLVGLMLAFFAIKMQSDIILGGIAINTFAKGITIFLMFVCTGDKGGTAGLRSTSVPSIDIPLIKDIPILGDVISGHNLLTYFAFIMVAVIYYFLFKTPTGLRLRAVGENLNAAESVGIKSNNYKILALCLSGLMASFGGIFMGMGYINGFTRNFIAGRGFIAMSAMNLGRVHPIGAMLASMLFGIADACANVLQALKMPKELLQMIPYVVTILALAIFSVYSARKANKVRASR